MKTIMISMTILIIVIGLKVSKFNSNNPIKYRVYKIDSINNYYLIYAKNKEAIFKIVSKKESQINCNRIKINKFYKFILSSIIKVNGKSIIPANEINEISGWRIDKATTINFEGDSIRDLFVADNIKGLCFIKTR